MLLQRVARGHCCVEVVVQLPTGVSELTEGNVESGFVAGGVLASLLLLQLLLFAIEPLLLEDAEPAGVGLLVEFLGGGQLRPR